MNPRSDSPVPGSRAGRTTSTDPLLDAHLVVTRGEFQLDLRLTVRSGEIVALVGPNGAGKTTALRALAGLLPLDAGWLSLAGHPLDDPAADQFAPPQRRSVGFVFSDHLLFAHLTAVDNVAFGLRCRGLSRRAARLRAMGYLDRVGLVDRAGCRPRELSGGQSQRVALARAMAVEPDLLLLDEPLAALDTRTRTETRDSLRSYLAAHSGATVLVTHDPLDATALAHRQVIIERGRTVQEGDAVTIAARPETAYVASWLSAAGLAGSCRLHANTSLSQGY